MSNIDNEFMEQIHAFIKKHEIVRAETTENALADLIKQILLSGDISRVDSYNKETAFIYIPYQALAELQVKVSRLRDQKKLLLELIKRSKDHVKELVKYIMSDPFMDEE